MSDLDQLASAAKQVNYYGRSPRASLDNPAARGFMMAVGASPVILVVLVLAYWIGWEITAWRAKQEIQGVLQNVPQLIQPRP